MQAAIYARYSSDLQERSSIEDQIRLCREHVERSGGTMIEIYTDYAISGGSVRNRPGMLALLAAAKEGSFDCVVAEALDRISRDQEDIAAIFKRLAHVNVAIRTIAEGEISELHIGLKGTMNALFLKDLAQKTRRGQRGRVEAGRIPGGNSYGYRVVRRILEDGSLSTGEREIDQEQAAIVRRIFAEYAAGVAPRQIAARLNGEGIPGPRGGGWNASTINGSRLRRNGILNNELYRGTITYNRQRFVKDPESGKRAARPNPEREWVLKTVPELRIVEEALWEQVEAIKQTHSSRWGNKRQTKKRLLSGLVRCGRCGGGMTISRGDRYYCSARREKGTCNSDRGIAAVEVECRVLEGLKAILLGNEELIAEFVDEFRREVERLRRQRVGSERQHLKELQTVERGIQRCLDFITFGDGDPGLVRIQLRELEQRQRELKAALQQHGHDLAVSLHPNLPALFRRKVGRLTDLLQDDVARPQAVEIIRSLVDRVEVHPGEQRGRCEIILVGSLARILAYMEQKATAASGAGGGGTFLMVAGARCHLYRTRVAYSVGQHQ